MVSPVAKAADWTADFNGDSRSCDTVLIGTDGTSNATC
jgi:hypothetical protein